MQSTQTRRTILALIGSAAALAAPVAMAHVGADGAPHLHDGSALRSLLDGALHPLTGLDHLAAMVSVGAWSAVRQPAGASRKSLLAAPLAFAATLLIGALAGMSGVALPAVEPMIAASLLVLGLMLATRLQLSTTLGAALVALFALFHGAAHGQELGGHAVAALLGMVVSTAALHGVGLVLGLRMQQARHGATARRLAGSAVALAGAALLSPALASAL